MTTKYKKSFLESMLQDGCDVSVSSKRVITLLAFILCSMAFVGDLFWDLSVKAEVFDGMIYIVIAGLGFTASEKFARRESTEEDVSRRSGYE